MTRQEHLLTILAEECTEVAQAASKALRFGLKDINPHTNNTAADQIAKEANDLTSVLKMLMLEKIIPGNLVINEDATLAKMAKVEKFLAYSAECGTLTVNHSPSVQGDVTEGGN